MRIQIDNISCQAHIGGVDNLLSFDLKDKLRAYMSMKSPGYEFTNQAKEYRATGRGWNGIRYFMTQDGKFASGFLPAILKYTKELGVICELEDKRGPIPKMDLENFNRSVGDWELREMQEVAVKKLNKFIEYEGQQIYWPRGIIDAATNAGKNSIMAGIVNNFPDQMALMIINREQIYKQAVEFFGSIFQIGRIDSKNYSLGRFTIAMQQSYMSKAAKSTNIRHDMGKFGIVFCDEAHYAGGKDYARLMTCIPAPIRVLVSGTPLDTVNELNNFLIIGVSGTRIAKITNKELIDKGFSLIPKVHFILNEGDGIEMSYPAQYQTNISLCQKRVDKLKDKLIREGWDNKQILVGFQEIEHGQFMYDSFASDVRFQKYSMDIVHGTIKDRSDRISRFKEGKTSILFGSTIMQEGLNIPNIQVLVFALAGKAKIPVKQFAGRGLRTDEEKPEEKELIIIDFYDNVEWLANHSRVRLKIWKEEEFEVFFDYDADKLGRPKKLMIA